jgi:hypothetical protein
MSWSLQIVGGDLYPVSNASGMGVVTGKDKTFQDLRMWMLETMGTDPMHPEYGSLLDGGRLPNGTLVDSFIGSDSLSVHRVEEEITRILQSFMQRQKKRIDSDLASFGKTTISDSEIIQGIDSVQSQMFDSKLVVRVRLRMKNNSTINITQPIG